MTSHLRARQPVLRPFVRHPRDSHDCLGCIFERLEFEKSRRGSRWRNTLLVIAFILPDWLQKNLLEVGSHIIIIQVYSFPMAAKTNDHKLGELRQQNHAFSRDSGGWMSEICLTCQGSRSLCRIGCRICSFLFVFWWLLALLGLCLITSISAPASHCLLFYLHPISFSSLG